MGLRFRFLLLVAGLAVAGGAGSGAWAGTGSGVSGPAVIDTAPPVITVEDPPAHTVLQIGQQISLGYTLVEDHPGTDPGDNRTAVWFGDLLWESGPDIAGSGSGTWTWDVPDTSSAAVHLVVTATDAFGNTASVASADFTILSGATDVPDAARGPLFARPAPNPFNPRTVLRFTLPEDGPVEVGVYDARGRRVRTLAREQRPAGPFVLAWDGRDGSGHRVSAGLYVFRLTCRQDGAARTVTQKGTLLP